MPVWTLQFPPKGLPTCKPNLMPFSIAYTGPAPVSTYFRPSEVQKEPGQPSTSELSPPPNGDSTAQAHADVEMKDASDVEPPTRPDASPDHLDIKHSSTRLSTFARSAKRYIASFRGRTVQGLDVPVPEGYRGLVLEVEKSTRPTANSAVNRAKKRVVESSAMNTEAPETPKSLNAIGEFPSFVVWSPDIPVNETRDKYLTAMAEWAFLAEQLHQDE